MTFRVGQKVVCVDADDDLVEGRIYTILAMKVAFDGRTLCKVDQTWDRPDFMWSFYAERFRPLDERKTDISVFTEILRATKAPKKVGV